MGVAGRPPHVPCMAVCASLDLLGTSFCNFVKVKSRVITNSQNMPVGAKQHIARCITSSVEATEISLT